VTKLSSIAEPGVDMRTLFDKVGFTPHSPAQWEYCESPYRFNIPCCGRRWGKSLATGHRMTHKMFKPETYNWIVGPTYTLGEKEFRVVYNDFRKLGLLKYCKTNYSVKQGDMRIQTPWDSVLEVKSAEKPDGLLGEGLSHAVMSETARHSRMIWEQYVEPALSDLKGSCDFPSTPQGYNWYHGLWLLGQAGNVAAESKDVYKSWSFPSWTNPVRFPGGRNDAEIIRIRATVSKHYFEQEYGAMFTSFSGAIYGDEWDDRVHVIEHKFRPEWSNFLAFDYGFANPFVALDIQVDPADRVYVWREYYQRYVSTYEHGEHIRDREQPEGYRIDGMWGDPRGADEAATLALMLGYVASEDTAWKLGVEEIKRMLRPDVTGTPRIFVDSSCTNLIRQMNQLHVKERSNKVQLNLEEHTGDGNIQHKVDDHAADAFRYFIGPYFVGGAGSHLEDVYGSQYRGSEAEDFFTIRQGMSMENTVHLNG
jgi:hypothetical protein